MGTSVTRERMITFLLEVPMFERLDPAELMEIIHIVDVQTCKAGERVFSEGDPGDAWYVLYRGSVEVVKSSDDGEKVITVLGPKSCFGEIAVLDGSSRSAAIRVTEDAVFFRVPRVEFSELLHSGNLVAYKLIHQMAILLASRQRSVTERLSNLLAAHEIRVVQEGISQIVGESSVTH